MELPEEDRLELARRIVAGIAAQREISGEVARAVEGIENIVGGRVLSTLPCNSSKQLREYGLCFSWRHQHHRIHLFHGHQAKGFLRPFFEHQPFLNSYKNFLII